VYTDCRLAFVWRGDKAVLGVGDKRRASAGNTTLLLMLSFMG
jgi:hypothetical protein